MTALADLKTRIADEINRTDLTSQIGLAVSTAVKFHKFIRLGFNESSGTLTTAASTSTYTTATAAPNTLPTDIIQLDSVKITTGTTSYLLTGEPYEVIEGWDNSTSHTSRPTYYAWHAEGLRLYPTPDAAYTITLRYLADVSEETWCTRAEALVRSAAKRELYGHVLFDAEQAATMDQIAGRELKMLLREARMKQSGGRIVPHD